MYHIAPVIFFFFLHAWIYFTAMVFCTCCGQYFPTDNRMWMLSCSDSLTLKRARRSRDGAHSIILHYKKATWGMKYLVSRTVLFLNLYTLTRKREKKNLKICTIFPNVVAIPLNIFVINWKCLGFGFASLFLDLYRQFGPFSEFKSFAPMMKYCGNQSRGKRTAMISKWNAAIHIFVSLGSSIQI